jgi:hypothetical protein
MGPRDFSEISILKNQSALRNILEERISHIHVTCFHRHVHNTSNYSDELNKSIIPPKSAEEYVKEISTLKRKTPPNTNQMKMYQIKYIFSHTSTALVDLDFFYNVPPAHSDISHSVGLLCMSNRPVAEAST